MKKINLHEIFDRDTILTLENRLDKLRRDIKKRGIRYHNRRDVLTGYSYGEYYDWDLYFENVFLSYFNENRYCRNGVEMFLDEQLPNGFVSRTMGIEYPKPTHHFKPFLVQTALLGARQDNNFEWLKYKYYNKLKKYIEYWFWFCDYDKNGMCVWDGSDHSGMDNQWPRLGYDGVCEVEGVDLNCYLVRELKAMAEISNELGFDKDAKKYLLKSKELSDLINKEMWDEEDKFYYDRNERTKKMVKYKSIAGFMPLFTKVASEENASKIIKNHLLNKKEFWLKYPIATWSRDEKYYYQESKSGECNWMGTTWIPTNYMIFHGLIDYGYINEAKELALKTYEMVMNEKDTREYYNAQTGSGQGLNPFWGWSALAYMMPLELELKYNPTDIKREEFYFIDSKL